MAGGIAVKFRKAKPDNLLGPAGYAEHSEDSDFSGTTFRVLKEKELPKYGEYRTRHLC